MTIKSLGNPYDAETDLRHGAHCACDACGGHATEAEAAQPQTSEAMLERAVALSDERAVRSPAAA